MSLRVMKNSTKWLDLEGFDAHLIVVDIKEKTKFPIIKIFRCLARKRESGRRKNSHNNSN
jgi:hypothetical protein